MADERALYVFELAATAGKPFEAAVSSDGTVFVSVTADMAQDIGQPQAAVLRARTLAASDKAAGMVWFERDKNPQQLTLRAFVEDEIFEFPLSFPPHN